MAQIFRAAIGRRPSDPARTALPGSPENRYDVRQIRCSSGESGLSDGEHHRQEMPMGVVLDHLVVPSRDKERSARFLARVLGLQYQGPVAHFAPVRINSALTFDFDNYTDFERLHYAFKVDSSDF